MAHQFQVKSQAHLKPNQFEIVGERPQMLAPTCDLGVGPEDVANQPHGVALEVLTQRVLVLARE